MRRHDGSGSVFNDFGCRESQAAVWLMPIGCGYCSTFCVCVCARTPDMQCAVCLCMNFIRLKWKRPYLMQSKNLYFISFISHEIGQCKSVNEIKCSDAHRNNRDRNQIYRNLNELCTTFATILRGMAVLFQSKISFNGKYRNIGSLFRTKSVRCSLFHRSSLAKALKWSKGNPAKHSSWLKVKNRKTKLFMPYYLIVGAFTRDQAFDGIQVSKCNACR